jgi:hypothetical protein
VVLQSGWRKFCQHDGDSVWRPSSCLSTLLSPDSLPDDVRADVTYRLTGKNPVPLIYEGAFS